MNLFPWKFVLPGVILLLCLVAPLATAAPEPAGTDGPVEVTADRLEVDDQAKVLVFAGNAVARRGALTIYGDRLTVRYIGEKREIDQVVAEGHVRLLHEGRTATGAKAIFFQREERIVLSGSPRVSEGENFIQGHEITMFLNDKRSVVTGSAGSRVNAVFTPKGDTKP